MKRTIRRMLGMLCLAALLLPGAGAVPAQADDVLRIALILPGKIDDVSWNQAMYEGMKTVEKELGDQGEVSYTEEVYNVVEAEPALRDFAAEGYDLVFAHGFQFMEPLLRVAEQFPDTHFALGTGFKTRKNTCVYDIRLSEGGYLMGILAGMMTQSDKIGVIGGVDVSEIYRGHEAFKMAAKEVNPDVKIQELYTGDWTDSVKAKEGAISMYDSGVDIIWHSGDGIGLGAVAAAKEKDEWILANVLDQHELAPDNVLGGIAYDFAAVIRKVVDDVRKDNFTNRENKFYWLTVANGGIELAPFHQHAEIIPQEVKDKLKGAKQGLADGSIEIPHFEK